MIASENGKKPVNYIEIAKVTNIHKSNVSCLNPFFENIGLIKEVEGEKGKLPVNGLMKFEHEIDSNPDKAKFYLHPLFAESWFGKLARKLLSLDHTVEEESLISSLGAESGAEMKKKRELGMLIEYLVFFKVIEKDEIGNYRLFQRSKEQEMKLTEEIKESNSGIFDQEFGIGKYQYTINFSITVTPETTKEDLEKMTELVKEFMK